MMTPALTACTDLSASSAGTPAPAAGNGESGAAFNAILTTMLPEADAAASTALIATDLSALLTTPAAPAVTDAGEALALMLPGLGLADATTTGTELSETGSDSGDGFGDGGDTGSSTDDDSATAALGQSLPDWLVALPLPAPLHDDTISLAAGLGNGTGGGNATALGMAVRLATGNAGTPGQAALPSAQTVTDDLASAVQTAAGSDSLAAASARAPAAMTERDANSRPLPSAASLAATFAGSGAGAPPAAAGWQLVSQGLEGLLRSREGRQVQALESAPELTALSLPGQPAASGVREPVLISLPQHALLSPDWGDAFSQHLVTLAQQGTQTASLQLNPEDLGPIHVRISLHEQAASVEFAARHAATSELIESALPRLAGAFEAHGLRLDDVKMSQMPARQDGFSLASGSSQGGQQGGDAQSRGQSGSGPATRAANDGEAVVRVLRVAGSGDGIDDYA